MAVDLILDVMRAASPPQAGKAQKKLATMATEEPGFFGKIVAELKKPAGAAGAVPGLDLIAGVMAAAPMEKRMAATEGLKALGEADTPTQVADRRKGALKELEASLLTSLIDTMLPEDAGGLYGSGTAGDIWRGMHAEQMAEAAAGADVLNLERLTGDKNASPDEGLQPSAQWPYFGRRKITPYAT